MTTFQDPFSKEIWETTYKYKDDKTIDDTLKRVANAMLRDGGKSKLRLDDGPTRRVPGVFVPQGNWSP